MRSNQLSRTHPSHQRRILAASLLALLLLNLNSAAEAKPKTVEELERDFTQERDSRKRARIALEILDFRLVEVRAFVAKGVMLEADNTVLPAYEEALQRLDMAVHAAAHDGTSKRIELGLRRHLREMEQVRMNVSTAERPMIEAIAAKLTKLREAVLYSIMAPKKK
jgi:hypothetical protein